MLNVLIASQTRADLIAQRYKRGAPFPEARRLDTVIASALLCPHCKRALHYVGYTKNGDYRAFAICNRCDVAIELKRPENQDPAT
jgi:transcription elongation factor Elf1